VHALGTSCRFAALHYFGRPIPGWIVPVLGFAYNAGWLAFALGTMWLDQRNHGAELEAVARVRKSVAVWIL
jgi:hypothetical protein